jgi:hypothetical protein
LGCPGRAADQDAVVLREDAEELEVLHRHDLVAHLPGHALALVDALRGQAAADRAAVAEELVGTVGGAHALHVVALDHTLVALALALALDVDGGAVAEHVGRADDLADREGLELGGGGAELAQDPDRLGVGGLGQAELGLVGEAQRLLVEAEDQRAVAVLVDGALADHHARASLDHGHRDALTVVGEHLRHPDLLAE